MTLLAGGMDDVFIESTLHLEDVAPHENFFWESLQPVLPQ
jgi:hypothetical protein